MPSLVATTGQSVDLHFKQVTIGSDPQCDIPMRANLGIAFRHVVLNVTPQGTWLQAPDLNQPVTVNGTRLVSAALQDGDVLTLGAVTLMFRAPPQEQAQVPAPMPVPVPEVTPRPASPAAGYARAPVPRAPTENPQVVHGGASPHPVVNVYGIPVTITPLSMIITGILGVLLSIAMITYMFMTGGLPLKPTDLVELDAELVSSQWVHVRRGSSYTLLTTAGNEVFSLPGDVRMDLGTMKRPVMAKIGVVRAAYDKHAVALSGNPIRPEIVTLSVDGRSRRTLARHNELQARMDNLMMFFGPVMGLSCLWMTFTGFEKRAAEKKNWG